LARILEKQNSPVRGAASVGKSVLANKAGGATRTIEKGCFGDATCHQETKIHARELARTFAWDAG